MKGTKITIKNITPCQAAMLAELLLYAYQENGFGFKTGAKTEIHDLNIWLEHDDVTIQETNNMEACAFSVLKESNIDPADSLISFVLPAGKKGKK